MPTLKPYTLLSRTSQNLSQNLAKSMVSPTLTDKQGGKTTKAQQCINAIASEVVNQSSELLTIFVLAWKGSAINPLLLLN